jgi:presequence protease
LRKELDAGPFFENLIRRHLLDNPHRVTLTLRPDPQQKGAGRAAGRPTRLAEIRATLTPADEQDRSSHRHAVLKEAAGQLRRISPACRPWNSATSRPRKPAVPVDGRHRKTACRCFWFDQPTNGIGYFIAHLDTGNA